MLEGVDDHVEGDDVLRRCRADAMLVQTPATLSQDLVDNLGAPELGVWLSLALASAGPMRGSQVRRKGPSHLSIRRRR